MQELKPNAAPPGALAKSRLGAELIARLHEASQIQVVSFPYSAQEVVTDIPVEKPAWFVDQVLALLQEDRLYTGKWKRGSDVGAVQVCFGESHAEIRIDILPDTHRIQILLSDEDQDAVRYWQVLLDPIAVPLLALLREAAPFDGNLQEMAFEIDAPPVPETVPELPPDILQDLLSVRPGMRRAEVLRVLQTEGGMSSPASRQYVHPKQLNRDGLHAKINVQFVPVSEQICWIEGRGYGVGIPVRTQPWTEQDDDIVVQVSTPYTQYPIRD